MTAADAAREAARHTNGQFGEQVKADPGDQLLDSDQQLAGELTEWLGRAQQAHDNGDTDTLESLDFDLPDLLDRLADRYGDDPAFTHVMDEYRPWKAAHVTLVDADDDGGDADVADWAEQVATGFANQLDKIHPPTTGAQR